MIPQLVPQFRESVRLMLNYLYNRVSFQDPKMTKSNHLLGALFYLFFFFGWNIWDKIQKPKHQFFCLIVIIMLSLSVVSLRSSYFCKNKLIVACKNQIKHKLQYFFFLKMSLTTNLKNTTNLHTLKIKAVTIQLN